MKHTKGKQKIEMKKVEDYEERMITFSRRKYGILKKMTELVAQCDAEASFVVFSESGKPHSFAHPSMEDAVGRGKSPMGHEPFGKDGTNIGSLVEAHKRQKNELLKKMYADFAKELEMYEEKERKLNESESGKDLDKKWWNCEGSTVEELKRKHQAFMELNVNACGSASQQFGKDNAQV